MLGFRLIYSIGGRVRRSAEVRYARWVRNEVFSVALRMEDGRRFGTQPNQVSSVHMPARPFATARTRGWLRSKLRPFNRKEVKTIEEYGYQVLSVANSGSGLAGFTYTIGLFDTCGVPELIAIGLPPETAASVLNDAARLLRDGVVLSQGRHGDLLENVECEFRPVDPKWINRLMLGATWFYRGDEFPVLQAVYPDLENRFPEDHDFDPMFAQPLLQPERNFGKAEEDFWKAHE